MDQLDEIRQKVNIVELVSEYVALKKAGRNFKALCPFHSENTPSFIVSPERQIWKCFGCSLGGDIFGFLMEIEGMEFGEALRKLAQRAGVKLRSYRPSKEGQRKQLFYEINHLSAEFYHYLLLNHRVGKRALDYILGRGISRDSLKLFKLGYSPNIWDGLQKFMVDKKKYQPVDLEEAGLIIRGKRGFYDRFRGRLMFPLRDHQGNIRGFAGRVLEKDAKEAKYINSPETPVYFKSQLLYDLWLTRKEIKKEDAAIIVEGELDAISSYQAGVKNVVAIKGSALTEKQLSLLKRFTQNLILAPDSDLAGDAAARRGIELADGLGFALKVVQIKGGKDPDEVAQKDAKLWQKFVSQAVPIYDYFLDSAFNRFDAQTAEGKRKIGQEIVPVLGKIANSIVRGHYISQLASRLRIDEGAIVQEVEKLDQSEPMKLTPKTIVQSSKKSYREILEEYLLALCFQSDQWLVLTKREVIKLITNPAFLGIIDKVNDYLKKFKSIKSKRLAKMLPAELVEIFNQFYLYEFSAWIEIDEKVEEEIEKIIKGLARFDLKTKLRQLSQAIKETENVKGSRNKLKKLNEEFRDLSAKLGQL